MPHRRTFASASSPFRGLVLALAGVLALIRGFTLHDVRHALLACGLGVAALALAVWHLARKPG